LILAASEVIDSLPILLHPDEHPVLLPDAREALMRDTVVVTDRVRGTAGRLDGPAAAVAGPSEVEAPAETHARVLAEIPTLAPDEAARATDELLAIVWSADWLLALDALGVRLEGPVDDLVALLAEPWYR
jgi:hypothetical protein